MMTEFYTTAACCSIGEEQCKLAGSSAVLSEQFSLQIVSSQENVRMSRRPARDASAGNKCIGWPLSRIPDGFRCFGLLLKEFLHCGIVISAT